MNRPAPRRANNQFNNAVLALPMWMRPVGEGAKRTIGVEDISSSLGASRGRGNMVYYVDSIAGRWK
jgi:hypothetical protein